MNTDFFLYYSSILGKTIRDNRNRRLGTLCDVAMKVNGEIYPKAQTLVIRRGLFVKEYAQLPWDSVKDVGDFLKLKLDAYQLTFERRRPKFDFNLCLDLLDQQVVDIDNRKVVRVNDIHFLKVDNQLYLAHVDVGTRGLVRRLGCVQLVDALIRPFSPHSAFLTQEDFISWKNAQMLNLGRMKNVLRLDVARQKLAQIHPTDLAEIVADLDKFEKSNLFRSFDPVLQQKVFTDLPMDVKRELIAQLNTREAAHLIENIPADEATDLLMKLPRKKTHQLMKSMETKAGKKLSKLLRFSQHSAGGLMTTEYLTLPPEALVRDAIQKFKENVQSAAHYLNIFVVDPDQHYLGTAPLKLFINEDPDKPIVDACYPNKIFVRTDDGMEEIALLLEKYKITVIPVLNEQDVLQGVITIDDVLEELISIAWSKYKEKL